MPGSFGASGSGRRGRRSGVQRARATRRAAGRGHAGKPVGCACADPGRGFATPDLSARGPEGTAGGGPAGGPAGGVRDGPGRDLATPNLSASGPERGAGGSK